MHYGVFFNGVFSDSFLLLMSDGLYKSYRDSTGSEQVNKEIAQMVVEQVSLYSTLVFVFICSPNCIGQGSVFPSLNACLSPLVFSLWSSQR